MWFYYTQNKLRRDETLFLSENAIGISFILELVLTAVSNTIFQPVGSSFIPSMISFLNTINPLVGSLRSVIPFAKSAEFGKKEADSGIRVPPLNHHRLFERSQATGCGTIVPFPGSGTNAL